MFGALGVALTVAGHRSVLGHDLAALRMSGVPEPGLRRAATWAYLGPGLLAVVFGAVAGAVGCVLVVAGLPLLPDPPAGLRNDLGLHIGVLAGCLVAASAVLTVAVLGSVRWLWAAADPDRLREAR